MLLLFISRRGTAVPAATDDSAAASDLHATEHCDAVVIEVVSTTGGAAFSAIGPRDPNIFTVVAGATLAAATTDATSPTGLARDFGEGATDALTVVLSIAAVASPSTASST